MTGYDLPFLKLFFRSGLIMSLRRISLHSFKKSAFAMIPRFLAAGFAAFLAIASFSEMPRAQSRHPFDESDSFKSDYAKNFIDSFSMLKLLSEAAFAQYFTGDSGPLPQSPKKRKIGDTVTALPRQAIKDEFCGCSFYRTGELADPIHCPGMAGVDDESLAVMSVLPLINLESLAAPLACYRTGSKLCSDSGGVKMGGFACCKMVDEGLRAALHDPYFYAIAPKAIVVGLKGLIPGRASPGAKIVCGIAIDPDNGVYSLPAKFNGMVARAWLHALDHYGTRPPAGRNELVEYSQSSPATVFELARERMIRQRYHVGEPIYDAALHIVPISPGFRELGAVE